VPADLAPNSLRQVSATELEIAWNDGHTSRYPVVYLRRSCRCAACVDEWTGAPILRPDQVAEDVRPVRIDPVGRYAIHILWSDGHTSGIYSFEHLREICPCERCLARGGS
jgi:DUF971 family protein